MAFQIIIVDTSSHLEPYFRPTGKEKGMRRNRAREHRGTGGSHSRPAYRIEGLERRVLLSQYTFFTFSESDPLHPHILGPNGVAVLPNSGTVLASYGYQHNLSDPKDPQPGLSITGHVGVFTSAGSALGNFPLDQTGLPTYLTRIAGGTHLGLQSGDIVYCRDDGTVGWLRTSDGTTGQLFNAKTLSGVDTSHIWDPVSQLYTNLGGVIVPGISSFGDVAVYETSAYADVFLAGSSAGAPFVLRVRCSNGTITSKKVVVGSVAGDATHNLPRGLAVNQDGTVVTFLPGPPPSPPYGAGPDHLISFQDDFDNGSGALPTLHNTLFYTRGMGVDGVGNFVAAFDNGYVEFSRDLSLSQTFTVTDGSGGISRDVAIDPTNNFAFMTLSGTAGASGKEIWKMPYAPYAPPLPPPAPTGLTATAASTTQVDLTWNDTSSNELGFILQRSTTADFSTFTSKLVAGNTTDTTVTGLSPNTRYYFRLYSFNSAGPSTSYGSANTTTLAGSVAGAVFHDHNANGTRDAGDEGLVGWRVFADADADGTWDAGERSVLTDAGGAYALYLPPGTHVVRQAPRVGWLTSGTPAGGSYTANVATGTALTGDDFGDFQPATANGTLYQDLNANGSRDTGEPGLAGWTVYQDDNNDTLRQPGEATATTDASGNWSLPNLVPGQTHFFRVAPRAGWTLTQPGPNFTWGYFYTPDSGASGGGFVFGARPTTSTISGYVFGDRDSNDRMDAGDPPLAGWRIYLDTNTNATYDPGEPTGVSDAAGHYRIENVAPGSYHIREELQAGWDIWLSSFGGYDIFLVPEQPTDLQQSFPNFPTRLAGTPGADDYYLRFDAATGNTDVFGATGPDPALRIWRLPLVFLPQLDIGTQGGDDSITVDFSGGDPLPVGGFSFDGGTHATGGDAVHLLMGPDVDTLTFDAASFAYPGLGFYALTNVQRVTVQGTPAEDNVSVAGVLPYALAFDGADGNDTLNISLNGATGTAFVPLGPGSGRYTFTNGQPVEFANVELDKTAFPPTVTTAQFTYQARPSITFTFSEDVTESLSPADLVVTNQTTGQTIPAGNFIFDNASPDGLATRARWDATSLLPDGNYVAKLPLGSVADAAGNTLAADYTLSFFVLAGDADRDRAVTFNDLLALARNYNQSGRTWSDGDFDGNGTVNFNDLLILAKNYNKALPASGAAPAPAAATIDVQALAAAMGIAVPTTTTEPTPPPASAKKPPVTTSKPTPKPAPVIRAVAPTPVLAELKAASVLRDDDKAKPVFSTTRVAKPAPAKPKAVAGPKGR
jgi:hypothetical protein